MSVSPGVSCNSGNRATLSAILFTEPKSDRETMEISEKAVLIFQILPRLFTIQGSYLYFSWRGTRKGQKGVRFFAHSAVSDFSQNSHYDHLKYICWCHESFGVATSMNSAAPEQGRRVQRLSLVVGLTGGRRCGRPTVAPFSPLRSRYD